MDPVEIDSQLNSTIYNEIRYRINNVEDYKIKNILRIAYLFGAEPSEYLGPQKKNDQSITGNAFSIDSINDVDALVLKIPTNRKGRKNRLIAVPLDPKIEPMSKKVLDFSEEIGNKRIYHTFYTNFQQNVKDKKIFQGIEFPVKPYKTRKDKFNTKRSFTLTHLTEVRRLELSLCNNFNELDFKLFCGDILPSDYNYYFSKLLQKSDYYNHEEVYETLVLKNTIFNPKGDYKYHYKEYMKISKFLKRGYLSYSEEDIKLNHNLDINKISSAKSGKKEHKTLMANAMYILGQKSIEVTDEYENIDVFDSKNEIAVECGDTSAKQMLDLFNERHSSIKNVKDFWILNYWGYPKYSKCYKFIKEMNFT